MKITFILSLSALLIIPDSFAARGTLVSNAYVSGCVDDAGRLQCTCAGTAGNSGDPNTCISCGPGSSCTYALAGGGVGTGKIKRRLANEKISR